MNEEKPKVKVYSLKLGPFIFSFKRTLVKEKIGTPKGDLIAAERYQAKYFGYQPLGLRKLIMSQKALKEYLEKIFSEQPEKAKSGFYRAMLQQKRHREKLVKGLVEVKK